MCRAVRGCIRRAHGCGADVVGVAGALVEFTEDHLAGGGLQHRGHRNIHGLAAHLAGVVHHHHGAVIQVGNALVVLFAFLEDKAFHNLARQHDGFERVGQLVDVEHIHALELGDFVEVEVVGDDFGLVELGQLNQLEINFAHGGEIILHDLHCDGSHLLDTLHDIEPAPSAVPLQRVGRVGHQLQLAQHKLRQHQHAIQKASFGNIGNAAVNDDAGIEDLVNLLAHLFAAKDASQRRKVEQVALVGPDNQANVGHEQHDQQLQEVLRVAQAKALADHNAEKISPEHAHNAADHGADQPLQAYGAQAHLEHQNGQCYDRSGGGRLNGIQSKGTQQPGRYSQGNYKKRTNECQIHVGPPYHPARLL